MIGLQGKSDRHHCQGCHGSESCGDMEFATKLRCHTWNRTLNLLIRLSTPKIAPYTNHAATKTPEILNSVPPDSWYYITIWSVERSRFCSSVSRAQGSASSLLPLCLTHMGISDSDSDSDSRISCNRFRHRIVPLKNSNFFHFFITRFLGFWTVDCWIGILASYIRKKKRIIGFQG